MERNFEGEVTMSWFDVVRKESDARAMYEMFGTYTPQDIPGFFDDDDELDELDIQNSITKILDHYSMSGFFQKQKVYKIDALVKEMEELLAALRSGDNAGLGYDFDFNTEEVLTELTEKNRLKEVIIEQLKNPDNDEIGYLIGGDSFKLIEPFDEPYNEMETFDVQTEEALRNI
jgi:hypothetical protein